MSYRNLLGNRPRISLMAILGMVALVSLTACGGTNAQPTATTTTTTAPPTATQAITPGQNSGAETEVSAVLKEWSIQLNVDQIPAGKVKFTVTNEGQMAHNLTVTNDSGTVGKTSTFTTAQGAQTLEVDLTPGTYTLICSVPGHASRGQKVSLTVK